MKALQMHYTSCRHGLSGHAGFQTRALSEGVRPEERRELERRGGYRPPRDAPSAPSSEELARDFPVAFRGALLDSGRAALIKSCYTGRDYSGRWGNFFAHSLVIEDGLADLASVWPIDLYEWQGWVQGLPGDGESESPPEPLPPVELEGVPPAESFRLADIAEFLSEEPGRIELLARMGRAVLLGPESSRQVVIRASALDGLFWIAAVQKLFPPRHAWRISFSTYQDDPRGCARVNATTGATDFRLDEADRKYRFYVFDLIDGVSSEVPEAEDDYPAVAARSLGESPERHEELFRFVELFGAQMPSTSLTSAVDLFRLVRGERFECPDERFAEAVRVASRWATPEGRVHLLDTLADAACRIGFESPTAYETLIRFLVGAQDGGESDSRRVFDVWWSFVRRVWSGDREASGRIEALWRVAEPVFDVRRQEAAKRLATVLSSSLDEEPPSVPVTTVLLRIFLASLGQAGVNSPWSHAVSVAMFESLGRAGALDAAFSTVKGDSEALVAVAYRMLDAGLDPLGGWESPAGRRVQQEVGGALGNVLEHLPAARAHAVRARFATDERWEVLLGEWLGVLARAAEPRSRYRAYRSEVLEALPGYARERGSEVAATLLGRLERDDARVQAAAWVEDGSLDGFGGDLAARCLSLANEVVPLLPGEREDDGARRLAAAVADAAESRSIELSPDRPLLYGSAAALERGGGGELPSADHWRRLGRAVGHLSTSQVSGYLRTVLPRALGRARNLTEHGRVLACLVPVNAPESAIRAYCDFIRTYKPRFPPPLKTALRFWLRFDSSDPETIHLKGLESAARAELVRALSELPQRIRSRIPKREIRHEIASEPAASRWREMEAAIERYRRSPFRRFIRVFRGGDRD